MKVLGYIFLGWLAGFSYTYAMMYEPEETGYSKEERAELAALVERAAKPKVGPKQAMTEAERREALLELWGG